MIKKSALGLLLLVTHLASVAQGVSGSIYCSGYSSVSVSISGSVAPSDVGLPGAVWVGIEDPSAPGYPSAFLTANGWVPWTTGGFPTYVETGSMPPSFAYSACIPGSSYNSYNGCATTSTNYIGWKVYAGYGVFTEEHQGLIAKRRASLDAAKPRLQQKGKWRTDYDDDVAYRNSLIQKSANDGRWGPALTISYMNCQYSGD